jgi:predicted Rossmann fold nucleotide-binding protein DprA/Smf involved in DNA uptake
MLTHTTQAVLLLTAHFSKPTPGEPKPLSPTEWGRFAFWLKEQGSTPEALLAGDPSRLLGSWADEKIPTGRIVALLSRSPALALALEKWQRAGLWVVTRSDPDYPARLKKFLRSSSPPLFFGCGERKLMNRGGLTVVGSRNANAGDLDFAHWLGGVAAAAGYSIVSGGARGIDESAMLGTLERDGTVIGVLADRLFKAAMSSKFRPALMARNLVLVSPFNPEASFDVGNAMARNKYVYCLSDAAVIVHSGTRGGTWSGALENLKNSWVPLWVKPTDDPGAGNAQLVAKGGRWLPEVIEGDFDIRQLFERTNLEKGPLQSGDLFETADEPEKTIAAEDQKEANQETDPDAAWLPNTAQTAAELPSAGNAAMVEARTGIAGTRVHGTIVASENLECKHFDKMSFYEIFQHRMQILTAKEAKTVEQLLLELDISKTQLNEWLKHATEEGKIIKKIKPVRYAWLSAESKPKQTLIFR